MLEKQAAKSGRMLTRFEKKYGRTSADFFKQYQAAPTDDADQEKWARVYQEDLARKERLAALNDTVKDATTAKRLAFIQCVGSRDFRFYPFCSGYCCMHSIKEAIIANEHEPQTVSTIFGMDIRAVGKGFEEYKIRGGNKSGITYVRGRVAEIIEGPGRNPVVVYEDTRTRSVKQETFDLVILATACAPTRGIAELAATLNVALDDYGFIKTVPSAPVDTSMRGIFVCGCAGAPMDVPESVAQASSAAERAAEIIFQSDPVKEKAVA